MSSKNIKIYLQYPWKFLDSPYYKYLVDSPPEGIEYLNTEKQKGVITKKGKFLFSNFLKKQIRNWIKKFNLAIPNAHLTTAKEPFDLIHCAHCLSKNDDKPWVADIESYFSFFISGALSKRGDKKVEKIILDKNCKKILPWTNATKEEVLSRIPSIKDKLEVVYPAVPKIKNLPKKNKKNKVKIIYAARYFWIKGGLVALEVLSKLIEKYDLEIIFVADVPSKIQKKYPKIKTIKIMTQEDFWKHLGESDIFFYPSLIDTFGFSLLEAMSFGIPSVAIDCIATKACSEIITNRKTGFVIKAPYYKGDDIYEKCRFIGPNENKIIQKLVEKISLLIENKNLREKMSKNCLREIKEGKFSIKERNKKLKRIYEEALK